MAAYRNVAQYADQAFQWDPGARLFSGNIQENAPGYLTELLQYRDMVRAGTAQDYEAEQYRNWDAQARAIPTRDIASLTSGWQGDLQGQWGDNGWQEGAQDWWSRLDPGSPDVGPIMLGIRDKMDQGTASPQERQLYEQVLGMAQDWNTRASVPQASDAFSPLGDQFFGALGVLGLGATGGFAAAPLFAGGAGLASTLGSLGTLAGVAGTGAGVIGQATDQPWLQNLGLGLGIAGGVAGGIGGLSSLWSSGVNSLTDAAKLASSAGKITGSLGRIPGADALKDVSRYLGYAGQVGNLGSSLGADDWLGWSGGNAPLAGHVAPNVQNLLSAADVATQRGGGGMEWDYSNDWGASAPYDDWSWDAVATAPSAYESFTGWGDPYGPGSSGDTGFSGEGSGGWLSSVLGGLGAAGKFLGSNASWLGPAASTLGSLGAGAIGSNAAGDAARLQAQALNRGIDLQTAQWLQQQGNLAPYLQAGQQGLSQLQQLAGRQAPGLPGLSAAVSGAHYGLPSAAPGWMPQTFTGPQAVNAGDYRWTPGQGPRAQDFSYTPGQIPGAAAYRYTPGAVPTLSGTDLLANDPGVQFRLDRGRKALEASALARGTGMSGSTLAALQEQAQDLSSQEYGNAWQRAAEQARLREGWAQQASSMGFGQAMSEAELRERVNQVATQQGWSQAQAEAAFREQLAQQASSQGFQQALAGQQNQYTQGFHSAQWNQQQAQKYEEDLYNRTLAESKYRYGQDVYQNQTDYERQQALYRQQLAQHLLPWEQQSTLANLGGQAVGMYGQQGQGATNAISTLLGQLGTTQGMGALGSAGQWNTALAGGVGGFQNLLRGLNA